MDREYIIARFRIRLEQADRLFVRPGSHMARAFEPFAAEADPAAPLTMRLIPDCTINKELTGGEPNRELRLWQEHIPGARLLNDDSPIIRMYQGQATAFGSPWSGKTPCYRNISRPIAGIVRLSQAPANEITRLSILRAVGSLLPSCPPAFAYDSDLQDRICRTLSDILTQAPVWHLACLPDKAAAELSYATVLEGKQGA